MDTMTDDPPDLHEDHHGATRELPGLAPWVVVSGGRPGPDAVEERPRRVFAMVGAGALLVLVAVSLLGVGAAHTLAARQAVNDAASTADLLSEAVVQPALENSIVQGDPAAVAALATALHPYMTSSSLVRVKLWASNGTILYSDEPRLIGQQFDLDPEESGVFAHPRTRAEVSDLTEPENRYERGHGRLLEAYRPVWTPNGTPLLFETYSPYTEVDQRAGQLWRGFAGVTVSSLLLFTALLVPLLWRLMTRVRAAQRQREALLQRAVDASADERQRIAGTLHDGVVQELAGASFAVSGAAARAESLGDTQLSGDLRNAAGTLRDSIGGLRTLLVDIYPETLESAGLLEVLRDLATTLRSRDIAVHLDLPAEDPGLGADGDRLVFRVVHECFQNVRRHASAANVRLRLAPGPDGVVLDVADDGVGFDPAVVLDNPAEGHFGLRVLADLAGRAGAELTVSAAPGAGCTWRMTLR
ncbi:MAG: integral rane sensor signal transduction histidine kinase [Marmoricola sp.]|nr:integral rane sensor signal transduction histidine kinase [Marmoricola sp.]